jgi:Spy/CpxP family protein refolding chaperone
VFGMRKSVKLQKVLGIALLLTLAVSFLYAAEEPQPPQRDQRDAQRSERGQRGGFDRAAMQERMLERIKERMGASDDEWEVIKPRLEEVMKLNRDANGMGGMRGMFGRGRGNRGPQRPEADAQATAVQKASTDLQETLEKEAPTTAEIKAKLAALRGAREKNKQQLVTAQQKLKEVLTVKQEAMMVMIGMLE